MELARSLSIAFQFRDYAASFKCRYLEIGVELDYTLFREASTLR